MPDAEKDQQITPIAVPLPLIHEGTYCVVHKLSALLSAHATLSLHDGSSAGIVKVFQVKSTEVGFDDMLVSLSDQRDIMPMAYTHKYIAPFEIIEVDVMTGTDPQPSLALVSPWYGNGDILNYVIRHPHAPKLPLVIQVGRALEHLHGYNIVHGNVYPGNIFITDHGDVGITDIGVHTQACRLILRHTIVPVQPSSIYQAPELLWPGGDAFIQPTKSADVYAFASTVFAVFVEKVPFHERFRTLEQGAEILMYGHSRMAKPETIDDNLWSILNRCWDIDAAARPCMANVLTALEDMEIYD